MLKKYSGVVQFSPSVVQDGVTKAFEAEEECPGLLGQLCHSTPESGIASLAFLPYPPPAASYAAFCFLAFAVYGCFLVPLCRLPTAF